jgi:hypothetical protein
VESIPSAGRTPPLMLGGGNMAMTIPVTKGDEGLVIYSFP